MMINFQFRRPVVMLHAGLVLYFSVLAHMLISWQNKHYIIAAAFWKALRESDIANNVHHHDALLILFCAQDGKSFGNFMSKQLRVEKPSQKS